MNPVTLNEIYALDSARDWAVGHFNIHNHEFTRAILDAAQAEQAPVILAIGEGSIEYMGLKPLFVAAKAMAADYDIPVAIHLDHGKNVDLVKQAVDLGFSSVMFDGSSLPYDENVRLTCQVVEMAHAAGASAEGEIGGLPPTLEEVSKDALTRPNEAVSFYEDTKVDALAVSLGSVHGIKSQCASLDCALVEDLASKIACPLVLHGASGVLDDDVRKAVKAGIQKINVNTGLKVAMKRELTRIFADENTDLLADLRGGMECVRNVVRAKIRLFGSNGKAVKA